jgi:hypothetical protein
MPPRSPRCTRRRGLENQSRYDLSVTVLWRMFNDKREHSRAVILPGGPPHTVAFFVNNTMDRVENYDTMDLAMFRAEDIKRSLIDEGWKEE